MNLHRVFYTAVLCLSLPPVPLLAGTTGKIAGVIRDAATKEVLPSVNVVVEGTTLGGTSNVEGRYTILNVPPGRYRVTASLIGYRRFEISGLSVSVDFTTTLNIEMTEGSVELEAVVVQAERTALIRRDLTNTVASISSENIEALPITDISEVIGLQGGVVVDDDGSLHIRGGLGNEVAYTVNGLNVNNPYGNTRAVNIATNAVQEVSVSSGTFNAEYGQALSGVVNYVTKEGGPKWTGSLRYLTGDYVISRNKDLYLKSGEFNVWNVNRFEASLGGPLLLDNLSIFASGVYNYSGASLYGQRIYLPEDSYLSPVEFPTSDPRVGGASDPYYFGPTRNAITDSIGLPGGSGEILPMNWSKGYNLQANIGWRPVTEMKLRGEMIVDVSEYPLGSAFAYQYRPDARPMFEGKSRVFSLDFTHTVSPHTFYTLKGQYVYDRSHEWVYESPYDPRYLPSYYFRALPNTPYLVGGVDPDRFDQLTTTWAGRLDIVSQILADHELKAGLEARYHSVNTEAYTLQFRDPNNPSATPSFSEELANGYKFLPYIPGIEGGYTNYTRYPFEAGGYVQDKIELFSSIIINLGFRYDYFDPSASTNANISQELTNQDSIFITKNLNAASPKHMPQPRLSVSFPITDQGTIRFSYGHFYQNGSLASLYRNPYYYAPYAVNPTFGDPDVDPQKSVQYEMGLQQGLTENLKFEITGYYKNVSNYIYTQRIVTGKGDKEYYLLTNLAYANTRGIIVSFLKRRGADDLFSFTLDYTFQVAEGNRTEPADEVFFNEQSGRLSETYLVPQGFDRSHTITSTVMLGTPNDWLVSLVGYLRAGTPYTPSFPSNVVPITFVQNSDRQPTQWNIDLKAEKVFQLGTFDLSLILQVDNLFDTRNELFVWENSGRALYNIEQTVNPGQYADLRRRISRGDPGMIPMSAVDNIYAQPGSLSRPRLVRFGASITF